MRYRGEQSFYFSQKIHIIEGHRIANNPFSLKNCMKHQERLSKYFLLEIQKLINQM